MVSTVPVVPITPDDKNWTWVLEERCPECGFDGRVVDLDAVPQLLRTNVGQWPALLHHPLARQRPTDDRWSALEYGCHVRDVFRLYLLRLELMLAEDGPHFANWDQDVTAIEDRYTDQDPAVVSEELVVAGLALADRFDDVVAAPVEVWARTGFRSDGVAFTIDSFARYFLHDPVHHVVDVELGYRLLG